MAREVRFENRAGVSLAGSLELPPGRVRAVALFAHCFTCTQASHGARRVTNALAAHGIATLRFDFTGLGKSGGDFADSHFGANVDDLVAAAAHLEQTIGAPSILIGHSLGGAAVIAAAARVPAARAVVTIGAPFDPAHALHHISAEDAARIEAEGVGTVAIGGRPFRVSRDFLDAAKGQDQATRLAHLKKALLVLHAPTDVVVGIDNAKAIYEAARHPKSFVALDGADHLLTDAACAAYAASIIAAWVEPFLLPAQEPDALPEGEDGPRLFFQKVPEGKAAKNRVHLDVRAAPGLEGDERMARLEEVCAELTALGAEQVGRFEPGEEMSGGFLVLQDPEGNEFCLD